MSRTERWKEEVLVVSEELRRLGAWHEFKVEEALSRAEQPESCSRYLNWIVR
jgi:hypothetical protein